MRNYLHVLFFFILSLSLIAQQNPVSDTNNNPLPDDIDKVVLDQNSPPTDYSGLPNYTPEGIIQWSQGFEATTFPPAGWSVYNLDGGSQSWVRYTSSPIFGTATASVRWESSTLANNDWLVTHQFLVNAGDILRFYAKGSTSFVDSVIIMYSLTGGTPPTGYNRLAAFRPTTLAMFEVPLNSLAGQNIYLAFWYKELDELRLYIDSVYVETPLDHDVGPISLNIPFVISNGTVITPKANIKNFGAQPETFNVTLEISPAGYSNTQTVTALSPGATQEVTFADWTASTGPYFAKLYTQLATDMNKNNDTIMKSFLVVNYIFDNGPLANVPGGGFGGAYLSSLQSAIGLNVYGFGHQISANNSVADDFTVPSEGWQIDQAQFFGYQTGSTTTSTFTEVRCRIWDGPPPTGNIIWGDLTTNRMSNTSFSNIYRALDTDPLASNRPIMTQTVNIGISLPAGTYWIEWTSAGTLSSGPWAPPITITGQTNTGNAKQNLAGTWGDLIDTGTSGTSNFPQGLPIKFIGDIIPVELTSFTATADKNKVTLSWSTATEVNNLGFAVERLTDAGFVQIGFIEGYITTTEKHDYSFVDAGLMPGTYTYRLRQVDLDGKFEYSDQVQATIISPSVFSLEQNYPNPFNPSTKITFGLAVDSKVNLKVFNILGELVRELVNASMPAGVHEVTFDALNLNSGVYIYKLEANGIDGSNFSSVKKMILSK
ncbi:MAG: T9SS type A sorting domain-containing protein [Ignavibacteriaceae bacterium]|nr:T9SS type A sorting domain-containing protein [Ignavibacteriaceae bacterium]